MLGRRKKSANTNVIALTSGVSAEEKEETDEIDRILNAKDLYDVLGVEFTPHWDSQEEAVREAYLDRSRLLNPSQNTDSRLGQAASRLAEAYDTLCDDELRTKYNLDNGFERPEPFGGLLGLLATAFGVNPQQQRRRGNNFPPPNQGPRTTPEERRARIQTQQRELEERHEEQQRNLREQGEQLARLRRQHQSGGLRAERSAAPREGGSGQQPRRTVRQEPRQESRQQPRQRELRFPASYRRQYGGGLGSPGFGGQRLGQGARREGQGLTTNGEVINADAIEARLREVMEALAGLGSGQGSNEQRRQQEDEDYTEELETLRGMGFPNAQQNLHALRQARGSVELAIEFLIDS